MIAPNEASSMTEGLSQNIRRGRVFQRILCIHSDTLSHLKLLKIPV